MLRGYLSYLPLGVKSGGFLFAAMPDRKSPPKLLHGVKGVSVWM
jgi:hypothetical protein